MVGTLPLEPIAEVKDDLEGRVDMKSKKLMGVVSLITIASMALAGCGNSASSVDTKDDGKEMTVDVFDGLANYQGIQKGWFAKIVKDKFNMKLNIIAPNVAGGGDTLFDTRSAAGNLGDLVIIGSAGGRAKKLVKAGLISDMTPYLKGMTYINKYKNATDALSGVIGKKGVWGMPSSLSSKAPTQPSEGLEPTFGPYVRWDYYKAIGYPKITDLDSLVTVLKQMQDKAREETGQKDIYAMSLFKDWDGNMMNNAKQPTTYYGYDEIGFVLAKGDGSDYQSITQKGGMYEKALKFFNAAHRAGILDPDSSTQNYDTMYSKYQQGKILFSFWPWLGQAAYNTTEHKQQGKGFMIAPMDNMKIFSYGAKTDGDSSTAFIAIGSKAKNKQRLVKFINWLYSPEGVYATSTDTGGSAGPKDLTWQMKGDEPVLTEFGQKALFGGGANVPAQWGGGTYKDGVSALNMSTEVANDIDPQTKQSFNPQLWPSVLKHNDDALTTDWSEHMGGAKTTMEYLEKNKEILVAPGASYTAPEEPSTISNLRGQIKTVIIANSWKASMADSDAQFNQLLDEMREKVTGLDFKTVLDWDMKNAKDQNKARVEIKKQWEESH